ncbi:MAG: Hpt domain-containing protein [Desulfovibrio sp.]|nr:Hpt domain-containing protein [Desulfovibrio sp.]
MADLSSPLPGIDVASGLPRVAGNKKLYLKLLRMVANDVPQTKEKLQNAIMSGKTDEVRELAHSLKGSSGNLSLTAVQAAAQDLESAAKTGDIPSMVTHLSALETVLDEFAAVVATVED